MAYTVPTAEDLQDRFPAFAAVSDEAIEAALAEAARMVDDSWLSQADFTLGRLLYAAHSLTLQGLGSSSEAQFAGFSSLTIGSLSLTRASYAGELPTGTLMTTSFGRQFSELVRQNKPGPIVAVL